MEETTLTLPRIAINGFGRIGRLALRAIIERGLPLSVIAVNDLMSPATMLHLFRHDSNYGAYHGNIEHTDGTLKVANHTIRLLNESEPGRLPWHDLGVDLVIESSGCFEEAAEARAHLKAGARRVLVSAVSKGSDITVVLGVNDRDYDPRLHHIVSNASCTTNCLAPVLHVLKREIGVVHAIMTTVHAYTNDQRILDLPHHDLHRARAAAVSIIPTTTGAARAVHRVVAGVDGKVDGMALRVPTAVVSVVDLVVEAAKPTTKDAVNAHFRRYAAESLRGILAVCDEPLVSVDFKGDSHSAIVDLSSTMVVDERLLKVIAWYDNEWGYSCRLADVAAMMLAREDVKMDFLGAR